MMQPHNTHRWRLLIGVVLVGLAVVPWVSTLIGQYDPTSVPTVSEFASETTDRGTLEGNTELKLPASATDIHGYVDGFRDLTTQLRFTLPARDFDTFLKQTSCTLPLYSDDRQAYWMQNSEDLTWWRPGDAQRFAACADTTSQLGRRFFFDMTRSDQYIVYVVTSTR